MISGSDISSLKGKRKTAMLVLMLPTDKVKCKYLNPVCSRWPLHTNCDAAAYFNLLHEDRVQTYRLTSDKQCSGLNNGSTA